MKILFSCFFLFYVEKQFLCVKLEFYVYMCMYLYVFNVSPNLPVSLFLGKSHVLVSVSRRVVLCPLSVYVFLNKKSFFLNYPLLIALILSKSWDTGAIEGINPSN